MATRRLILIDGNNVLYRAFFAIRDLSTSGGRPTNAVFGFVKMLRQLRELHRPSHWMVTFDGGLPEERTELLEEYKAQRTPMPDSLREQVGVAERYLDCAGISWCRVDGQEADDVMASVLWRHAGDFDEALLATGDKDMYQLVTDAVRVVPVSGSGAPMGPEAVAAKTGVLPGKIVEWLAMIGDSSDNIPGVPGVGPKTASKLLNEYESIEGIWEHLHEISSAKIREGLAENRSVVDRNIEMVRLKTDVACSAELADLEVREPNADKLLPLFEELEFKTMAADLRQGDLFG